MSEMSRTREGRWAEDILAKIPPRLTLKNYFEVVDRIGWLDLESKREIFTRLELKNSIEKWLGDLNLPSSQVASLPLCWHLVADAAMSCLENP